MATAAASFDRGRIDSLLSQLSARVFLMNNVHEDAPVIFETRWGDVVPPGADDAEPAQGADRG